MGALGAVGEVLRWFRSCLGLILILINMNVGDNHKSNKNVNMTKQDAWICVWITQNQIVACAVDKN